MGMDNKTAPELPTISTTDKNGVRWDLDPNKKRWSATVAGKKMSSGQLHKLQEKVLAATPVDGQAPAPGKADPTPTPRPIEVALVSIRSSGWGMPKDANLLSARLDLAPVLVKMEWNAAKGAMEVVRYKTAQGGWKHRDTEDMILFHPSFAPDAFRDLLARTARAKIINTQYQLAATEIAGAWWRSKPDQTIAWEVAPGGGIQRAKHASSANSKSVVHTNPQWLLPDPESLLDFSGWTQTDSGSLRRGPVSIDMVMSDMGTASFQLRMESAAHVLHEDLDLETVLALGNATHFMTTQPEQSVHEWCAMAAWNPKDARDGGSFPSRRIVQAAALFQARPSDSYRRPEPKAFVLTADTNGPMASTAEPSPSAAPKLVWKPANPQYYPPSFRPVGPEDEALLPLQELRAARNSFEPDTFSLSALSQATPAVLAQAAGMIEDGEELATDLDVMAKLLEKLIERNTAAQSKSDDVVQWQGRCRAAVDQASKIQAGASVKAADPVRVTPRKP